ncbi:MAG TPA: methionine adenosyltransferase [Dongiaceae bacterium]
MDVIVERAAGRGRQWRAEVVERKGAGHPDSICDSVAEAASLALCRWYSDRFGQVLHHNLDKVLLRGGAARPVFGGGKVVEPMEIYFGGRATAVYGGVQIPVEPLIKEACRNWFRANMRAVDVDRHLRIKCLVRPGSADLTELFMRRHESEMPRANDTSCGVGFWPLTAVEGAVLRVDRALTGLAAHEACPALGEDIKIMAVRRDERLALTVAAAMIGRELADLDGYMAAKLAVADRVATAAGLPTEIIVNAADEPMQGSVYLTVTGTSAEAGDDGEVGRGNRANGLITPYRPMTMEAVAGKNPVNHVGKIYNIAASRMAREIHGEYPDLGGVSCLLVSRIGAPINDPQLVHLWFEDAAAAAPVEGVRRLLDRALDGLPRLSRELSGLSSPAADALMP